MDKRASARDGLLEREREVIRILSLLLDENPDFIVVGGYAVSTYKKRFSIDLDLVVSEVDLNRFESILKKQGYINHYEKKVELLYGENFKRFMKKLLSLPVDVDLLINGLVSRTTNASWGFDYIKKNSIKNKLNDLEFLIPKKELLIAMKFHSGRLSDIRDIVALMPCNEEELKKHLLIGDLKNLKESIKKQLAFLEKPQFDDSFKGIFGVHVYNKDDVEKAKEITRKILKEM
ncbi:hypothetical protein A3K73_06040 [Candidatus Pacearchaeota archaeon RBG_13_36_9]|nr:MAG: hypothetical protein A3K73_06040 [Candidatus Pacearchaeota archaeon RBG_13_36_9]